MRFARHAKIFRGPLDPAPVAAVLLLPQRISMGARLAAWDL